MAGSSTSAKAMRMAPLGMVVAALAGCAAQTVTPPEHNYALALHGSTVVATRGVGGHQADSLVNGVVDPEQWDDGEGWEAPFIRNAPRPMTDMERLRQRPPTERLRTSTGYAQVEIRLAEPRRVNRVVVHALDTEEHPFKGIEKGELMVRSPGDSLGVWRTVATIENGKILIRRQIKGEVEARTVFRFPNELIEGVRLQVYETGEAMRLASGGAVQRGVADTVRLLEIEVSGPEALDIVMAPPTAASDEPKAPPRATVGLPAPPVSLKDALTDRLVRLSEFRGRVVLLYPFIPFSDTSAAIDLGDLRRRFDRADLAIVGLAVDKTDGRQTRQMIERYQLNFPVLLADETAVMRYEGVGSTYLIGRDGVLLDRFGMTRARDMGPLLDAVIAGSGASAVGRGDR